MSGRRCLVIGASGLLGNALMRALADNQGSPIGTYSSHARDGLLPLDIRIAEQVHRCIKHIRPETIYLTAALTYVDYCEDHPDEAFAINTDGAWHVVKAAAEIVAKVVFYSTDYVFDGASGPYDEHSSPCPINVYGRSKLAAEEIIRQASSRHLIVRTTGIYGWENGSTNFAMQVYDKLKSGARMRVPQDQIANPTLAGYLAQSSVELVQREAKGVVNVVGKDLLPRSEFAKRLADLYGFDRSLITPVPTASLNQRARRPLCGGLRTVKLSRLFHVEPIGLKQALTRLKNQCSSSGAILHG